MKFIIITALGISIFCASCSDNIEKTHLKESNQIVLIFDHPPDNQRDTLNNGLKISNGGYEISYYNDEGRNQNISLTHNSYDTITIKTQRETVEIGHAYKALHMFYYLFQNGDTAVFRYEDYKPIARIINRHYSEIEINYPILKMDVIDNGQLPENIKFSNPFLFSDQRFHTDYSNLDIQKVRESIIQKAKEKQQLEFHLIDSLSAVPYLSKSYNTYIKQQSIIKLKLMELKLASANYSSAKISYELTNSDINFDIPGINTDVQKEADQYLSNSSNIYYHSYHAIVHTLFHFHFSKKVDRVITQFTVDGSAQAGGNMPNYMQVYDTIQQNNVVNGITKELLLFKSLESVMNQAKLTDRLNYLNKYEKDAQDTMLLNLVRNKYQTAQVNNYSIKLLSFDGDTTTYDELLTDHTGEVLYIDFWASWCRPCIKEMSYSTKLKDSLSHSVRFIYISTDKEFDNWKQSIINNGITSNSYIIINPYVSVQWDEMNIGYIPRYFIIDKNGHIVNNYAPRPSDKKIISEIEKYL